MVQKREGIKFTSFVILSCSLVFLVSLFMNDSMVIDVINRFGLIPLTFVEGYNYFSVISYLFIHIDLAHFATNMFVLYSVGSTLENNIGSSKFALMFTLSGVISGVIHSLLNPDNTVPVVGASGAIFGVIAVLFLYMPFTLTTALIVPVPGVVLGLFLLFIEIMALISKNSAGIAHDIHLFGFIMGSLGAFLLDYNRAIRGLLIAIVILLIIYFLGVKLDNIAF